MKPRTKRKIYLAIAIVMVIVGIVMLLANYMLVDFRMDGGYTSPTNSSFLLVLKIFGIIVLEFGTGVIGVTMLCIGAIATYNNAKKMMR